MFWERKDGSRRPIAVTSLTVVEWLCLRVLFTQKNSTRTPDDRMLLDDVPRKLKSDWSTTLKMQIRRMGEQQDREVPDRPVLLLLTVLSRRRAQPHKRQEVGLNEGRKLVDYELRKHSLLTRGLSGSCRKSIDVNPERRGVSARLLLYVPNRGSCDCQRPIAPPDY